MRFFVDIGTAQEICKLDHCAAMLLLLMQFDKGVIPDVETRKYMVRVIRHNKARVMHTTSQNVELRYDRHADPVYDLMYGSIQLDLP